MDEMVTKGIDEIIRRIIISAKSDYKILMSEGAGYKEEIYYYKNVGFRDLNIWLKLMSVLKNPPHIFDIRNEEEAGNHLPVINEILIEFIKKEFGIFIPDGYKIYEQYSIGEVEKYQFKFQIKVIPSSDVSIFEVAESVDDMCKKHGISKPEAFRLLEKHYASIGTPVKAKTIQSKYYRGKTKRR